jgi:hypothetical protein
MLRRLLGLGVGPWRAAKREALAQARAAELRGELAQAAVLFAQALRPDEAARVMVLRGDAEVEPAARLRHYVQAVATAPPGSQAATHAARKRASAVVDLASDMPMTTSLRQDLAAAARDLEELGDAERAAQAYARAGDLEGEVRALTRAGDVDRVDALLALAEQRDRDARARAHARDDVEMLVAAGRRREAVAIAQASADEDVRSRGIALAKTGVTGGVLRVAVCGREMLVLLGEPLVIGRAPDGSGRERDDDRGKAREARLAIASAALSRRHVVVERRGDDYVVRDLGSRNGTSLRGLRLEGEAHVGEGLELKLAGEVPVSLRKTHDLGGALAVDLPAGRYVVPLGPTRLPVGRWRLERADDGWAELVTDDAPPAFAGALQLAPRVTLLVGDAIAAQRSGPAVLEVRAHDA